ncbi:flagellar basal body L-ring protein FlgH [Maritalea porphyrae]|uniref:Flagellar L-ring protein n=1 Tax=Maritalea porphyrae TaxID=880732 RepID=A0ABQ5UWA1_9HYPH|nr:flagellar basal body L-ring protein FlgH [Maritalea porphyrae]GLQ18833.1 flagellar L-ring protein 1 [Maritalea porphyrae]
MKLFKIITIVALGASLAACTTANRLAGIGKAPTLTTIENPTAQAGYKPVNMPMPAPERVAYSPNSLFISGTRGFFKDQRASKVGDILTVQVTISDKAQFSNKTARSRTSTNDAGAGGVVGSLFNSVVPGVSPSTAIELKSGSADSGNGSVDRSETLETQVAAVVIQVLPNGNLVIEGRQEVRVNFEVRDLIVAGIVRPEDIGAANTIPSSKIAQARISYGGRGQITDVQQPRYGQQFMDAILPF